jgi:queuine tRNA-ribosyltransferase
VAGVRFEVVAVDAASGLRAGLLHTSHGVVPTPTFMPVGTLGSVKGLTPSDVYGTGARVVLSNSYHLALQPGVETVQQLGGLHALMRWDGPMLTDSGGFQVFSLGHMRDVSDAGVTFASHLDGAEMLLTPECVVDTQERLGADLIMPLDECLGPTATHYETERALERTQHWWRRSLAARTRDDQALFALVQGGLFDDLRRAAARDSVTESAPGFAIGGLSIGEPKQVTANLLQLTLAELPADRPRYLMGVGHPRDLVAYARMGVDLFDCVLPTRLGRNGTVWSNFDGSRLDLARRALLNQSGPIIADCTCVTCVLFSVGGLAALFQHHEPLGYRLASIHNLTVLGRLATNLRREVLYTARQIPMVRKATYR